MNSYEGSIELIGQVKTPYVGPDIPQKYIKSFRALKKDFGNLPTDDDQASGSFVRFLDTSEEAEYHDKTKRWYIKGAYNPAEDAPGSEQNIGDWRRGEDGDWYGKGSQKDLTPIVPGDPSGTVAYCMDTDEMATWDQATQTWIWED